jgi:hypothetical protein
MRTAWIAPTVAAFALAAPSAHAAFPAGNLVVNGDAESGAAPTGNCSDSAQRPNWTPVSGVLGSCAYGFNGDFPPAGSVSGGGTYLFYGPSSSPVVATQTVDVSVAAAEIDAGKAQANLQADLGGWNGQDDQGRMIVHFLNGASAEVGSLELQRVYSADRNGQTILVRRTKSGQIPAGTRSARVELRLEGGGSNDGYADNLMLTLSEYTPPPPPPPPPPATTTTPTTTTTPPPKTTVPPPRTVDPPIGPTGSKPPAFGPNGVITGLPSTKRCVSRRNFEIRIKKRRGRTYATANIFLNSKQVVARRGSRVTAPIDLRGLPKGRFTVRIVVVTVTGEVIAGTRKYRTCTKKRRSGRSGPL